jgi:digeranylgeranylglycerophospholipid reductase
MTNHWDAIVVGAGPAGASAALPMARAGMRVLMIERRRQVGVPVQCAEYIPLALAGEVDAPESAVAQRVTTLRTFIEGRAAAENHWPGVILNRPAFDAHLAARAVAAGATLWTDCAASKGEERAVLVGARRLTADVIVGADGPRSTVARSIDASQTDFVCGLQVVAPLTAPVGDTEVHFRPEFVAGYGWLFPKGPWANVGVAVARAAAASLPKLLNAFLDELRLRGIVAHGATRARTGGLIPVGGPPPRTQRGRTVLAGDAAGQTDPITGSGIPAAIACGRTAGEAALGDVGAYDEEWRAALGHSLDRALRHRRRQYAEWNQGSFERLIRNTWIAFPESYRGH